MTNFPNLFSPIQVGPYILQNRIMNTGHAAHFQLGDGTPTDAYAYYVRERAKGGAGVIVTGHTVPVYDGDASLSLTTYSDATMDAFTKMAQGCHEFDVPLIVQLGHRGRRLMDHAGFLRRDIVAPSPVPTPDYSVPLFMPHELSTGEVEGIVESFGAAADRMRRCDFDGIELAIGMDYLFANFLHPHGNRRDDKYGGNDLRERMTFLNEVLEVSREGIGKDRILGVRLYDDGVDYSMSLPEHVELAKILEAEQLVDYINIWQAITSIPRSGRAHWPSHYFETGAFVHLSEAMKDAGIKLPIIGAGRQDSPAFAEQTIADGKLDIVGMAKTLIADPHFPNKAREGRIDDIRTCIACTQSCVGHVDKGLGVGCIYNPVTGREQAWGELEPADEQKRVVIVGAGPAGMEAARTAAMRGHSVVLFERNKRMGGQVNLVMTTPKRGNFEEVILWFERQLPKVGVDIRLGVEADAKTVLAESPDVILVATGSTPFVPEIMGADLPHVHTAREVLVDDAVAGTNVLVFDVGGRAEGATTAAYLAAKRHRVRFVTGMETVAPEMPSPARHHLLEVLMNSPRVELLTHTSIHEIKEGSITTFNVVTWEPDSIEGIDTVVVAAGGIADDSLYRQLAKRHPNVQAIGDCYQPRDIEIAIVQGHQVGREI
jgi:2,4-dienoyl-CoA reductase-like NADH-dependent reductase (Old Yellow Enzyme family)/NADPH-dependent 2,4-dienoyl-CoA reductase/sulfur reductase-like enzyme